MTTTEGITYYHSHITNEPRARCEYCGRIFAHWEDDDDLAHDCRYTIDCTECNGEGGPPPVWDEDLHTHHVFQCGYCAGRGWRWHYPNR